jgi:hypothetical protein
MGVPIRGELWKLGFFHEGGYGSGTSVAVTAVTAFTGCFGIVTRADLPDPVIDFVPFWSLTTTGASRGWNVMYRGKARMEGGVGDFLVLDGHAMHLAVGNQARSGTASPYTHTVSEALTLTSICVQAEYIDAAGAASIIRRWFGGKVGSCTWSASEGDFLKMSLGNMTFVNMIHNQSAATTNPPFYTAGLVTGIAVGTAFSSPQPYLFSYGSLTFAGTEFARVRSFRLSVNNALEPKYYITTGAQAGTGGLAQQMPYEYREGKRRYDMSMVVDIEDGQLYKDLLWQGMSNTATASGYRGFQTTLVFNRGTNDTITFSLPGTGTAPSTGLDAMGCFVKSAPHGIDSSQSIVSTTLGVEARSLQIVVVDSNNSY